MAKYTVKCHEMVTYTFELEADDNDEAWFKAHDVLLGETYMVPPDGGVPDGVWEGALRLVEPDNIRIQCDIENREWDVREKYQ